MSPTISVIVPVYNAEKYLRRCINSIIGQSFTDFELLLIDDGSIDKSRSICDEYAKKDRRVRVLYKENGGASSARNYGLCKAIGEYICFIDADDWVDMDYLQQLLPMDGEDMVVCSLLFEGECKRYLSISDQKRNRECIERTLHLMLEHMAVCSPCCKIMRRDIIVSNKIRFDVDVTAGEDMLFVYDYFSANLRCVRTMSLPLYHYFVADDKSLSHRIVDFDTTEYVLDCIKERIDKLSAIYDWDSNDGYKRIVCTQLDNFKAYIKNVPSFFKRIQLIKKIIDNKHISLLLSDVDYLSKRKRLNGMKTLMLKVSMIPLKLYYILK